MKNLKKKFLFLLTALILVAGATVAFFYFGNREERLLRAMVGELEEMAAKRSGKSGIIALLDAATPERVFASKVTISSDLPKVEREFTLKELSQLLITMKKSCTSAALNVEIQNLSVNSGSAEITGGAVFSGSSSRSGSFREVRDIRLLCTKIDGKWKISTVKIETVIKK